MSHRYQAGKLHPGIAALIVIVLIGVATAVVVAVQNNQQSRQEAPTTQQQSSTNETAPSNTTEATGYRDGTYSATGSYISPGGRESIELEVTIENGVITATDLEQNATSREGRDYQAAFAGGYAELVVGKNVDEVSLSRVAGSSLTSNGFNAALDQIKDDAAA